MPHVSPQEIIKVVRENRGITIENLLKKFRRANESQILEALEKSLGLVYRDEEMGNFVTRGKAERAIRMGSQRIYLSREGPVEQQIDGDGNIRLVIRSQDEANGNPIVNRGPTEIASLGETAEIGTFDRLLKKLTRKKVKRKQP